MIDGAVLSNDTDCNMGCAGNATSVLVYTRFTIHLLNQV